MKKACDHSHQHPHTDDQTAHGSCGCGNSCCGDTTVAKLADTPELVPGKRINALPGFTLGKINYTSALSKQSFELAQVPQITSLANQLQKSQFRLSGLDCADCAAKLEKRVQALPGVVEVRINFGAAKMTVSHSVDLAVILDTVKAAGYQAELDGQSKATVFRVSGMDCADCAAKLEKKLLALPGVAEAKINFGAGKLTVKHSASVESILKAIEAAGYQGQLANEERKQPQRNFFGDSKLLLTAISGILVAGGFVLSYLNLPEYLVTTVYLTAILSGGFYTAKSGWYSLKSLSLDMNFLMAVAVIGAAAIGEWAEGATVVFLFALGNTLQAYTMDKTRNSIRALMDLSPKEALVRRAGQELRLPVEELVVGDLIIVKPGERIPMDGEVVVGRTDVNQAPITGESMPVEKTVGQEVYAGTINGQGAIEMKVTKLVEDTTLAKIIQLVEEAQAQKAPSQQFVDVFAKYYTPAVIIAAVLVAVLPWLFFGQPFQPWFERALILLVVSCPCALVISTPVSIVAAIGSAAKKGVLIKGGAYLEEAGALKVIAFDKTGTLTAGKPEVNLVIPTADVPLEQVLEIAAAIETRSQHPLAEAILKYARERNIQIPEGTDFQSFTGKGAGLQINGEPYYIGNRRLLAELNIPLGHLEEQLTALQDRGQTVMLVSSSKEVLGLIAVADKIRESSRAAVAALHRAGITKLVMLTGDNAGTAKVIAEELGIDDYRAELLPESKLYAIQQLQQQYGKAAMVGDGVNDAPALATATVGIAMGGAGTDTALETADIALMADDLTKLPYAMHLSRKALGIIKQNIGFSLVVKGVFLVATFLGMANLWMAVFADTGAALLVIANGMRLMKVADPYTETKVKPNQSNLASVSA
ncbi:heavy metal translocating P-type ATPase [Desulfotomaculum nigrificans]|uniref:heavy metal translocating P-type ATPase n=1 Tax=Desulfotomaculum nigrificans TaxID=1565 RepID=UPI0001FAE788|nr:heavy metal translocating P-type ATPase [Desulfotomaculum nigrificans]